MPDVGMNALAAFEKGRAMRREEDGQNALAQYATNPTEEGLAALAPHRPEFVIQQRQQMQAQQREAEERNVVGAALNGDPEARKRLAYVNSDMYLKLDEHGKKQLDETYGRVAQGAYSILQLPPAEQGPALQQFLQQMRIDPAQLKLPSDPTAALKMALAYAGKLDEWEQFAQPKYSPVGEAGLAGFQFGKPIMQGAQPQNFGPAAPPGVTFTPIPEGGGGAPGVTPSFLEGL